MRLPPAAAVLHMRGFLTGGQLGHWNGGCKSLVHVHLVLLLCHHPHHLHSPIRRVPAQSPLFWEELSLHLCLPRHRFLPLSLHHVCHHLHPVLASWPLLGPGHCLLLDRVCALCLGRGLSLATIPR